SVQSFRFSTDGLAPPERSNAVLKLRERGIIAIEPLPGRTVHVDVAKWFLPGLGILSGTLSGIRQVGTPQGENDDLFFGINVAGRGSVTRRGGEIPPAGGDAFLLNVAAGAFAVSRPRRGQFLGLRMPRQAIAPLVRGLAIDSLRLI